jgi:15-cis-phytoene synthase
MKPASRALESSYRARAIPAGSTRYYSWLFAHETARAPLLGIYALLAEWNALADPAMDRGAARIRLGWWQEEIHRLVAAVPLHPIGAYLSGLPHAAAADFMPLLAAVAAAAVEASGAPLERAADLVPHACALHANPLALASRLAGDEVDEVGLGECAKALAVAEYLSRSLAGYRRDSRFGRVPFAVDELMAAGIENADLCAENPPARLERFLQDLRNRASQQYAIAARVLPDSERARQRHLLVLAALGRARLNKGISTLKPRRMQDMLLAWSTARRATAGISRR